MSAILEVESTLTDRYQTTVPESVRRTLGLDKRDKIQYTIRPGGEVVLSRVSSAERDGEDPVLGGFLAFLARDMAEHPEHLKAIDARLVKRLQSLTRGVEVDLGVALSPDDE